jgi:hypothetical protein
MHGRWDFHQRGANQLRDAFSACLVQLSFSFPTAGWAALDLSPIFMALISAIDGSQVTLQWAKEAGFHK